MFLQPAAIPGAISYASELSWQTGGPFPAARLVKLNCSAGTWPSTGRTGSGGSFCAVASDANGGGSRLLYRPGVSGVVAVQIVATTALGLNNASGVTVRNLDLVGPVERVVDVVGGADVTVMGCSMRWGSFAAVAVNYKSAAGSGLEGGALLNSSLTESGSGLYVVNQGRPFDASANTNHFRVAYNRVGKR